MFALQSGRAVPHFRTSEADLVIKLVAETEARYSQYAEYSEQRRSHSGRSITMLELSCNMFAERPEPERRYFQYAEYCE